MSRLESSANFARLLLDDFESAERVCESKSGTNLAKHELIIRRLNTHIEMDRAMVTELISDMRAVHAREQEKALMRIGKTALEGGGITTHAVCYYEETAKVLVLDELIEKIEREKDEQR